MKLKQVEHPPSTIILYGTTWCYGSRQARHALDESGLPYQWVDIDQDINARHIVETINEGYRSVPTIIFPDGSVLVEPDWETLRAHLERYKNPSTASG